jgi:hypothetical protein
MSEATKDLIKRAGWTFIQAFLAVWIVTDAPFTTQAFAGAVGAGLSALKTFALANK